MHPNEFHHSTGMPMSEELNATALWFHSGDQLKGRNTRSTQLSCPFSCFNQQYSVFIIANNMPKARRWDTQFFLSALDCSRRHQAVGRIPSTRHCGLRSPPTCHFTSSLASTHHLSCQHNFECGKCPLLKRYLGHMYTWEKDWS